MRKISIFSLNWFFWLTIVCVFLPVAANADAPPSLGAYLTEHPELTQVMRWDFPVVQKSARVVQQPGRQSIVNPPQGKFWQELGIRGLNVNYNPISMERFLTDDYRPPLIDPTADPVDIYFDPEIIKNLDIHWDGNTTTDYDPAEPQEELPPVSEEIIATWDWTLWPEEHKQQLQIKFDEMWAWIDTCWPKYQQYRTESVEPEGFSECFNTQEPANYPPQNLQWMSPLPNGYANWTVIPSQDAFDLYTQMIALSLALELKGILGWTIAELNQDDKSEILDGTKWFRYVSQGPSEFGIIINAGYMLISAVMPSPAKMTFSFLAKNKLIQDSKYQSLLMFAEWERVTLRHSFGGIILNDCEFKTGGLFWLYKGISPLSRIINGTVMGCPIYSKNANGDLIPSYYPEVIHWVGGCGGTSSFNQQVLRTINFPAIKTSYGHFQNKFIIDNNEILWMGHADDTYGTLYSIYNGESPEIPIQDIFLDNATFKSWVVDYNPQDPTLTAEQKADFVAQNNVATSKRAIDLMLKYLPKNILIKHCTWDQGKPHEQTYFYNNYFHLVYTVQELDTMYLDDWGTNIVGVWENMDAKVASLGGCYSNW